MTRPRPGIGSELLPVFLVVLSLVGTLALVISVHHRASTRATKKAADPVPVAVATPPAAVEPPKSAPPPPPPRPAETPEDPTKPVLARLEAAEADQIREARKADQRAEALEGARRAAVARSDHWRRREALVRSQIDALSAQADRTEQEVHALALERDVLERERDAARAALAKARSRTSYAILPHKGPNGTWRRPIVIECRNGTATLQPNGPTFSMLDMSGLVSLRASPIVTAVARELVRAEAKSTPDGAPVVPYIFFVVRPDGIRPYYEARARLEPLGIAFGYELVDQDWEIDFDDLNEGDRGPTPIAAPPEVASTEGTELSWPGVRARRSSDEPADAFVWPARPTGTDGGRFSGSTRPDSLAGTGRGGLAESSGGSLPPRFGGGNPGSGSGERPFGGPGENGRGGDGSGGSPLAWPGEPRRAAGVGEPLDAAERPFAGVPGIGPNGSDPAGLTGQPSQAGDRSWSGSRPSLGEPSDAVDVAESARERWAASELPPPSGPRDLGGATPETSGSPEPLPDLPAGLANAGEGAPTSTSPTGVPSGLLRSITDLGRTVPRRGRPGGAGTREEQGDSGSSGFDPPSAGDGLSGQGSGSRLGRGSFGPHHERIEVPFEIVVACEPNGVVIHPGGYRISRRAMKSKGGMLVEQLEKVVKLREQVDPLIRPRPMIKFLIEPGGSDTYWEARRQTMLARQGWPTALQVESTSVLALDPREVLR